MNKLCSLLIDADPGRFLTRIRINLFRTKSVRFRGRRTSFLINTTRMRQRTAAELESSFRQFVAAGGGAHDRAGDAGFLALYEHYNPRFGIYVMKRYRLSFVEAEDVLQTTWERVLKLRAKGSLSEIENFGAFLFRALTNEAVDVLRRRRETVSIESAEIEQAEDLPTSEAPFSKMNAYVLSAFDGLSEDHREVLILQLYCGYELSEIAAMLEKSRDAIWARASRARSELRKRVAELAARKNIAISEFKVLAS